ncbi:MAG TPA: glycine--tRNA ligase [Candidatus Woesearchaeota archaeon]|nr:glycine--tRNA ligase [Candidatus Woesearchaeota archaeon]
MQAKNQEEKKDFLKEVVSFIQEQGFIWGPSPEIYGGFAGFYTYGPFGKLLKNRIEESVRRTFFSEGMREIECPTVLPDIVWKASGHLETFSDRTIECSKCHAEFNPNKLIEENHDISADSLSEEEILAFIKKNRIFCPSCKGALKEEISSKSLMMKTKVAGSDASLRPETATTTYLPFPMLNNLFRKKLPFGVFQIGKAYRNEISPRQHLLRCREFTQAEGQVFIDPKEKNIWEKYQQIKSVKLPFWSSESQKKGISVKPVAVEEAIKSKLISSQAYGWCIWLAYTQFANFGIPPERIRLRQHHPEEKAFYAQDAWDIEVRLDTFGWTELCGVHDRTDYDLKQHAKFSSQKLEAQRENGEKFIPHILEIAFGTDRPTFALMDIFYTKKEKEQGKTMFKVPYHMAPVDVSVFPLMKKPELTALARKLKAQLEKEFIVDYDESGSIGKRYLRSACVGTPYAITIDYDSIEKGDATIRDRDTEDQVRLPLQDMADTLRMLQAREITFSGLKKLD